MIRWTLQVLVVLVLCTNQVWSQESTGSIEGRILDSLDAPVPGTNISIKGPNLQGIRGTVSDKGGYFRLLALPVGTYDLKISHIAYQSVTYEKLPVRLGRTNSLGDIRLASRTAEMPEVTISGARPLIDATSTTTGANLEARTFESLPTDRNFRSIITIAPGANSSSYIGEGTSISGSTGYENVYFIDGINVTEPIRSSTSTDLPYNFVREVEVKTGGYEPEYASALGGVVNVVTQSGSNDFSGQVFSFFTNNGLTAERRSGILGETVPSYSFYDVGVSLGGPVVRDRLWFYGAYNPSYEDKDVALPGMGRFPDRKRSNLFAGKLNWNMGENTHAVFSLIGDPNYDDGVQMALVSGAALFKLSNPDPLLRRKELGGVNISLQGDHRLSDIILLEISLAGSSRNNNDLRRTERGVLEPYFTDDENGINSGGTGGYIREHTTRLSGQAKMSFFYGDHTVKIGVGYEENTRDEDWTLKSGVNSQLPGFVTRINDTTYTTGWGQNKGFFRGRIPSAFVQDSWLLTDRLRLNAGVRWTGEFFIASDGNIAQKIIDEIQPRAGFTCQMGNHGEGKIYGSYGRFYEQVPLLLSGFYFSNENRGVFVQYNHDPRGNYTGGDTLTPWNSTINPEVPGLKGQCFDEFSLGYEHRLGTDFKVGIRGLYRNMLQVIEDGMDPVTWTWYIGNPGSGPLSFLPAFTRQYRALEFTFEKNSSEGFNFLASYILSRLYGNYAGLFDGDYGYGNLNSGQTNVSPSLDTPDQFQFADGLLPNDRTHIVKFSGSYAFGSGLSVGATFIAESGLPLNEFGTNYYNGEVIALQHRGSLGRTPATWDLNLRATYTVNAAGGMNIRPKLILDVFHLFSRREALLIDQIHYLTSDVNGVLSNPSPTYGQVQLYQPPMSVRLGMEVSF